MCREHYSEQSVCAAWLVPAVLSMHMDLIAAFRGWLLLHRYAPVKEC